MSIFEKIKGAIFGRQAEASEMPAGAERGVNTSSGPAPVPGTTPAAAPAAPKSAPSGTSPQATQPVAANAPGAPTHQTAAAVDVAAIMDKAVKDSGQKLDWRKSIVDMMKALGLDSGLADRKELAQELGYTGDTGDSATMNIWLHKALMKKLAENGGKVPAELAD